MLMSARAGESGVYRRLSGLHAELTAFRRDLHAHPELGFEEQRTAARVAEALRVCGVDEVHTGIGKTGVVGVIRGRGTGSGRTIGLRAEMDALPMTEDNEFAWRSSHKGVMHGCGHDGHVTMLIGAARHLAETREFDGTAVLVFQPGEEGHGGAKAMIDDGLFDRFPVDAVYGMHNMPGIPAGRFAMRVGAIMAGVDRFDIRVIGRGGHAAFPHRAVDTVLVQAQIVTALQSLVARNVDPLDSAVVSVTKVHGGEAYNILPEEVVLSGCIRYFTAEIQQSLREGIERVARGVAQAYGARIEYEYHYGYPATVNTAREVQAAARAAAAVVGESAVDTAVAPVMGAEDFAYMLQARPGAYILLGNGDGEIGGCMLHNPRYDFNDAVLPIGASYWVKLVEQQLG